MDTGRLFHCYILDESICHFRGVGSVLLPLFYFFLWKILLANIEDPDQMPHYVASDLGLHCLHFFLQYLGQIRRMILFEARAGDERIIG